MPHHNHAVVWIDHHEARIIHFNAVESDQHHVTPVHPPRHLHLKAGSPSGTHVTDEPGFYADVLAMLHDISAILIGGPATAKDEFAKHVARRAPEMISHIFKQAGMDHPTDNQLLAEARRFFARADRMTPQRS